MSRLGELRVSLLAMTPDQLREHIRQIRIDRRIIKDKPATKVAKRVQGGKAKNALLRLLEGMSEKDRALILRELGNADQGSRTDEDQDQGQGED